MKATEQACSAPTTPRSSGERLLDMLASRGWRGRIVPASHLVDLEAAIGGLARSGRLDPTFHRTWLADFTYDPPHDLPRPQSIIVVAAPVPQVRVFFNWNGERFSAVVPPTYAGYTATNDAVQDAIEEWLAPEGYRIARPELPLKTLAVRSGLARYGRNNICYVAGMGSFLQLAGVVSDMPCADDTWGDPQVLPRCESCVGCRTQCPTGAIGEDRFLLRAERCLTYHNEATADMPGWIHPSWHHCLIGCMRCQAVCPENKAALRRFDDRAEFSELETGLLAGDRPAEGLPPDTLRKMRALELNEPLPYLRRNLRLLVEQRRRGA